MFTMLEEVEAELEAIEKLTSLKDKISRTTKFLKVYLLWKQRKIVLKIGVKIVI